MLNSINAENEFFYGKYCGFGESRAWMVGRASFFLGILNQMVMVLPVVGFESEFHSKGCLRVKRVGFVGFILMYYKISTYVDIFLTSMEALLIFTKS